MFKHDYDSYLTLQNMKAAICYEIVMLGVRTLNIILKIPQNCGVFYIK